MKHELLDIYFLCRVLDVMETIDDDCDDMDVVFVAVKVQLIFIIWLMKFKLSTFAFRIKHCRLNTTLTSFQH